MADQQPIEKVITCEAKVNGEGAVCGKRQRYRKPPRVSGKAPRYCKLHRRIWSRKNDVAGGYGSWEPIGEPEEVRP